MAHFCDRVMYFTVLHSHLEVVTWYGDCSTDIGGPAGSTAVAESINENVSSRALSASKGEKMKYSEGR